MTRRYTGWPILVVFAIVLMIALSLVILKTERVSHTSMNTDSRAVENIFEKTRTFCFGRFIMDIPEESTVIYGSIEVDGELSFFHGKARDIQSLVSERIEEIEKERDYIPDDQINQFPLLGKKIDGVIPGQKIVFGAKSLVGYSIHSYIPIGEDLFVHYSRYVPPEHDEIPLINSIATHLRARSEREVPADAGICVEGGFLSMQPQYENIQIGLIFKELPDVRFSIDMRKNQKYLPEGSSPRKLREQARASAEDLGLGSFFARIKVLREGSQKFSIWEGEEILTRRPAYKNETDAHEFRFFSMGSINDNFHPNVDIRLDTGVSVNKKSAVKPSITDEEALALWDRLLSTIRLRQPSDASSSKGVKPRTPLGAISKSGEICPQSGYWECIEKKRIDGARRRLFKAGETIPPVIVTSYTSILRTMIGDIYRITYVDWKLSDYEATPASGDVDYKWDERDGIDDRHA